MNKFQKLKDSMTDEQKEAVLAKLKEAKEELYNMSQEDLIELHRSTTAKCLEVMMKKNNDYTSGGSVFANFNGSTFLEVPPVIGILLRSMDKFKRIQTFVTTGGLAVEGEGVLDAIDDVVNYMILAKGIIIEQQRRGK
jgi:hypothetical protein